MTTFLTPPLLYHLYEKPYHAAQAKLAAAAPPVSAAEAPLIAEATPRVPKEMAVMGMHETAVETDRSLSVRPVMPNPQAEAQPQMPMHPMGFGMEPALAHARSSSMGAGLDLILPHGAAPLLEHAAPTGASGHVSPVHGL